MNKLQRKKLQDFSEKLREFQIEKECISDELQAMADEELDKHDNLPDSLQFSSTGDRLEESYDALCSLSSDLSDIDFSDIIDGIDELLK